MFKKIALAAALVSSAAFATWDYYPVLEGGKGSVKGNLYYDWDHDWSHAGLGIGVRYSVIQNLEHFFLTFTDCQTADGIAVKADFFQSLGGFFTQISVNITLLNAENTVTVTIDKGIFAAFGPAHRHPHRLSTILIS